MSWRDLLIENWITSEYNSEFNGTAGTGGVADDGYYSVLGPYVEAPVEAPDVVQVVYHTLTSENGMPT